MYIPLETSMIELGSSDDYDSDRIGSDVEAELYSSLHHEVNMNETIDLASPCQKISSSIDESLGEIFIISEDESDEPIPLNVTNGSRDESFTIDTIGDDLTSDCIPDNLSQSFDSPKKKKCKVSNLAVESGNSNTNRKSNVVANLLENIQVQTKPKRKRRKRKSKANESTSSSKNITIEISDSDSYHDLSDLDESGIQYIHTNISNNTTRDDSVTCLGSNKKKQKEISDIISLDSDSEDDSFKFELNFNSSFSTPPKDLWKINETDLYRTKRKSGGRYHEESVAECTNCNRKGHSARYCLEPKAYTCCICGGTHSYLKCKQRMCEKCLRFGHSSRYCLIPVDQFVCTLCNMRGHLKKVCPDLWRRYHLTTSGEQIRQAKKSYQKGPIYCFNCGEQGHFGFQCGRKRIGNSYPILPAVISYQHPLETLQVQTPEKLPPLVPAPQVPSTFIPPQPAVPLLEVNQPGASGSPAQSKKAKKKFENMLRKKKAMLQKKVEKRMTPLLQNGPQYTPKMVSLKKINLRDKRLRRPTADIVNELQMKIQNTPPENKKLRRRLKRKLKYVQRTELNL